MASRVLDASVILAIIFDEPGARQAEHLATDSIMCSVNYAEVLSRHDDRGGDIEIANELFRKATIIVPFDAELARATANLRRPTRSAGLSLADRACLALAQRSGLPAVTADRAWAKLDLGIEVQLIR